MTILKALKNLIAKSGGSTKAGTIAEAINDMPVGGGTIDAVFIKDVDGNVTMSVGSYDALSAKIIQGPISAVLMHQRSDGITNYVFSRVLWDTEYNEFEFRVRDEEVSQQTDISIIVLYDTGELEVVPYYTPET